MKKSSDSGRLSKPRRLVAMSTAVLAAFAVMTTVSATHGGFDMEVSIDTLVHTAPGVVTVLAVTDVPDEYIGHECAVEAVATNQISRHVGNDLIVATGSTQVTIENVEAVPGQVITASGDVVLGTDMTISLVMGPERYFSGGITVVVDCEPAEVIETTVTTTPAETTTVPEVTTTVPDEVLPTSVTTTTVPDEVLPTEVSPSTLPFTGSGGENLALIALALTGLGVLLLVATRSRVEE